MQKKAVFFDLDGTLLPMDQDQFVRAYFGLLAKKLAPYGYEQETLIQAIWKGTGAMVKNDGSKKNEAAFWDVFTGIFGKAALAHLPVFEDYYAHEFQMVQSACGYQPLAAQAVSLVKEKGLTAVLATNPIFPAIATESRICWAGLKKEDFACYTTYENSRYCKPNPAYYQDLLDQLHLKGEECLMVGNDATEDLAAMKTGMDVFLLTDCLINKENLDLAPYPHGDFQALLAYLENL